METLLARVHVSREPTGERRIMTEHGSRTWPEDQVRTRAGNEDGKSFKRKGH